jgi:hypothetical protein
MKYRIILGVVSSGTPDSEPPRKRQMNTVKVMWTNTNGLKEKIHNDVEQIKIIIILFVIISLSTSEWK